MRNPVKLLLSLLCFGIALFLYLNHFVLFSIPLAIAGLYLAQSNLSIFLLASFVALTTFHLAPWWLGTVIVLKYLLRMKWEFSDQSKWDQAFVLIYLYGLVLMNSLVAGNFGSYLILTASIVSFVMQIFLLLGFAKNFFPTKPSKNLVS